MKRKIHKADRKAFESYFPPPTGMTWDEDQMYYRRANDTILLGDCMKWDRMLQVWLTAKKVTTKQLRKKVK